MPRFDDITELLMEVGWIGDQWEDPTEGVDWAESEGYQEMTKEELLVEIRMMLKQQAMLVDAVKEKVEVLGSAVKMCGVLRGDLEARGQEVEAPVLPGPSPGRQS